MTTQELDKYLSRIGYTGGRELTGANLDKLIWAHISAVPFENITVFDFDQVPSLEPEDLYKKIVDERRGGYCFELNTSLHHLLMALGYEAYPVVVRLIVMPGPPRPYAHKGVVAMAEGKRWYCDVGYGGPGPKGVMEIREGEQVVGGLTYRGSFEKKEGAFFIERKDPDGWHDVLYFPLHPIEPCDFIPLNFYIASNPTSPFRMRRTVNLTLPDGSKAMTNGHYTLRKGDLVIERDCADNREIETLLRDEFGMDVALPDRE